MTADRPYSRRRSLDEACAEIERCAGSQFDPSVASAFVEEVRRQPPSLPEHGRLSSALDDPELTIHREGDESLLGSGSLAVIDNLTLLYSHRYLHEAASAAAAVPGRGFSVAFVDLGGLPAVNERGGHAAGDELIRAAARAVQDAAVRTGATACRYGGPRLAMLVPDTDAEAAEKLLREALSRLPEEADARVVAVASRDGERGSDVIQRARAALRVNV
jgi:diguanylate cyclase (GGDEF)-like protein